MEKDSDNSGFLTRFLWIFIYILGISIVVPIILGVLAGVRTGVVVSFIFSAFALQAIAAPLGLPMGLSSLQILVIMLFFGFGVIMGVFEVCQVLGASSKRVSSFIGKIKEKTGKYKFLQKYGAISCFLIVWIPGLGLYGTPVIAWLLSWKRIPSIIMTLLGFMLGCFTFLFLANAVL